MKNPVIAISITTHPRKPHVITVQRRNSQRLYYNASTASFYRIARLATTSAVQRTAEETRYVYRYTKGA